MAILSDDVIQGGLESLAMEMRKNSERWFPQIHNGSVDLHVFYSMGFGGEAGEVLNESKKILRKSGDPDGLAAEMADAFTYLLLLADECEVNLVAEYRKKVIVNEERWG